MNSNHLIIDHQISPIAPDDLDRMLSQADVSDAELLSFFDEEAAIELIKMESLLQAWDGAKVPFPRLELCISFHTLKGTANSIGQMRIGALAAGMESLLRQLEGRELALFQADIIKTSVIVMQAIKQLLQEAHTPGHKLVNKDLLRQSVNLILNLQRKVALIQSK